MRSVLRYGDTTGTYSSPARSVLSTHDDLRSALPFYSSPPRSSKLVDSHAERGDMGINLRAETRPPVLDDDPSSIGSLCNPYAFHQRPRETLAR